MKKQSFKILLIFFVLFLPYSCEDSKDSKDEEKTELTAVESKEVLSSINSEMETIMAPMDECNGMYVSTELVELLILDDFFNMFGDMDEFEKNFKILSEKSDDCYYQFDFDNMTGTYEFDADSKEEWVKTDDYPEDEIIMYFDVVEAAPYLDLENNPVNPGEYVGALYLHEYEEQCLPMGFSGWYHPEKILLDIAVNEEIVTALSFEADWKEIGEKDDSWPNNAQLDLEMDPMRVVMDFSVTATSFIFSFEQTVNQVKSVAVDFQLDTEQKWDEANQEYETIANKVDFSFLFANIVIAGNIDFKGMGESELFDDLLDMLTLKIDPDAVDELNKYINISVYKAGNNAEMGRVNVEYDYETEGILFILIYNDGSIQDLEEFYQELEAAIATYEEEMSVLDPLMEKLGF